MALAVAEGKTLLEVATEYPVEFMKYNKGIGAFHMMKGCVKRDHNQSVTVDWYYGRTGTGKSRKVHTENPEAYVKCSGNDWWDHYAGQKTVIFDDFRGDWFKFATLLNIIDRYATKVPFKGGICELSANHFLITSCKRPEELFCNTKGEKLDQLLRRITTITELLPDDVSVIHKSDTMSYIPVDVQPFVDTFHKPS